MPSSLGSHAFQNDPNSSLGPYSPPDPHSPLRDFAPHSEFCASPWARIADACTSVGYDTLSTTVPHSARLHDFLGDMNRSVETSVGLNALSSGMLPSVEYLFLSTSVRDNRTLDI